MNWNEKLLGKFLNSPGSIRFNQIENLLLQVGFQKISVRGSHRKYRHPLLKNCLIVPVHNNDCKKFYKVYIAKLIKQGWKI